MTQNVEQRLSSHNNGKVRSTKFRAPFKIIYTEKFQTRIEARHREKFLKSYKGSKEKMDIVGKFR